MKEPVFNDMQRVKRQFFALRNGVISDTLRKAGSPFHIIFGLNLPQIAEVAAATGKSNDLAERLWQNNTTRESMLLAPMIVEPDTFTKADAHRWVETAKAEEVVDVLCLKLLKKKSYALDLAVELSVSSKRLSRYASLRLLWNLVGNRTKDVAEAVRPIIEIENDNALKQMAQRLNEECEWLLSPGL